MAKSKKDQQTAPAVAAVTATNNGDFVTAFVGATQATLQSIDTKLIELDLAIDELQNTRAGLRSARKSLNWRFNGRPQLKKSERGPEAKDARLRQIAAYLWEHEPASGQQISAATTIPLGSMHKLLKHPWFMQSTDGYEISEQGVDELKLDLQERQREIEG